MKTPDYKVAVCSMFRDSQVFHGNILDQCGRFFREMDAQAETAGVELQYFLVEGDSTDNTLEALLSHCCRRDAVILNAQVGGPPPSASGGNKRRELMSRAGNVSLNAAVASGADLIFWMESDLIPTHDMMNNLLVSAFKLDWSKTLAVAPVPVIFLRKPGFQNARQDMFYDGWAFERADGRRWDAEGVWNGNWEKGFKTWPGTYMKMNSIGSCAVLNAVALREHQIDFGSGCFPELCKRSRDNGYDIYCDTTLRVYHPSTACVEGRWV